jgi:hypothetical protein
MVLASTPHEEPCTQAGSNTDDDVYECIALIDQLKRELGEPPANAGFFILRNIHEDAGEYHEAAIFYDADEENPEGLVTDFSASEEYALEAEASIPDNWDEIALAELKNLGHTKYQPVKVVPMTASPDRKVKPIKKAK